MSPSYQRAFRPGVSKQIFCLFLAGTFLLSSPSPVFSEALRSLKSSGANFPKPAPENLRRVSVKPVNAPQIPPLTDAELLDILEARAAKYFMEKAFPQSGLVFDLSSNSTYSSIGATGFGLAALPVIAERSGSSAEWTYTVAEARARAELILDNLLAIQAAQQPGQEPVYGTAGFFYHFVNASLQRMNTQIELSIIDTAIVLAGALTAGNYFGGSVQTKAGQVFDNVDWSFFFNTAFNQFYTGWKPEFGFNGVTFDRYSDEAMLVSLLALRANPGNRSYEESLFNYPRYLGTYGPYTLVHSYYGSLFTYIVGHAFYDFETLGFDRPFGVLSSVTAVDWRQNSIQAAKANRQFCIDHADEYASFGPESWGLSATVRPNGSYFGDNGARPADSGNGNAVYDGTMPTAMGIAAMPFFKAEDGAVLGQNLGFQSARRHYDTHYADLWGPYGFYASFNHLNQFSNVSIGIELGPLVLMIENYRSRLIWDIFMNDIKTRAPLLELFSFQSVGVPAGNNYTRECEHWTTQSGGNLDFKPHASNGQCLGGGWGRYSSHYATYAVDLVPTNNLVFNLRYASDFGGGWVEIYVDNELRGSFYAPQTCPVTDGCGWDNFQWGSPVQIGGVSPGIHVLKLKTLGTPFGLNIDVFNLRESTETPPVIEELNYPDGHGFTEAVLVAPLSILASDPDLDVIEYQFSVNDQLAEPWSGNASFDLTPHLGEPGIIRVRIQVRDGFGGVNEVTAEYAVFRRPIPPPPFSSGGGGGGGNGNVGSRGCKPSETDGKEGGELPYVSVDANCYPTA
ncbi:MAG: hypothetical protein HY587_04850 [Candidatus Omnitrophica bacterium]|nr:hypothetical protein [Candidatus Omnitrophota bacterium]